MKLLTACLLFALVCVMATEAWINCESECEASCQQQDQRCRKTPDHSYCDQLVESCNDQCEPLCECVENCYSSCNSKFDRCIIDFGPSNHHCHMANFHCRSSCQFGCSLHPYVPDAAGVADEDEK